MAIIATVTMATIVTVTMATVVTVTMATIVTVTTNHRYQVDCSNHGNHLVTIVDCSNYGNHVTVTIVTILYMVPTNFKY